MTTTKEMSLTKTASLTSEFLHLTPRELTVLELIAKGESNEKMAKRLGVCRATVVTHRKHLYQALNAKSGGNAVFKAFKLGILRVEDEL